MTETQTVLTELDQQIKDLKTKAQTASDEVKLKVDQEIQELEKKATSAHDKLRQLESASGDAWKDMKKGLDSAVEELKTSCNRAMGHFK